MEKISIVECAPIEGFKLLKKETALQEKVDLINTLSESGIHKIEVVSFVHPRLIPQFADAEDLMKSIVKKPGVIYGALTPSEIACRRAIFTNVDEISVVMAVSETYNQVAFGHSLRELMNKVIPSIINIALEEGKAIRAYIPTSFGCPYEGDVAVYDLVEIVSKLDFLGASQISIADSAGMATPMTVRKVVSSLKELDIKADLAVHFHDTRGMGLVNAMAAFESGIRIFDTAVGGMSAKPFGIPNSKISNWNIPTEDLVNMFESMGITTGVDMDILLSCVSKAEKMLNRKCSGHILIAGVNKKLFKPPVKLKIG